MFISWPSIELKDVLHGANNPIQKQVTIYQYSVGGIISQTKWGAL